MLRQNNQGHHVSPRWFHSGRYHGCTVGAVAIQSHRDIPRSLPQRLCSNCLVHGLDSSADYLLHLPPVRNGLLRALPHLLSLYAGLCSSET